MRARRVSLLIAVTLAHAAAIWHVSGTPSPADEAPKMLAITWLNEAEVPAPPRPPAAPPVPPAQRAPVRRTPAAPTQHSQTADSAAASEPTVPASSANQSSATESATATTAASFDAAYLKNPPPIYPSISRRLGEQGKVELRVQVSAEGLAEQIELRLGSGFPRLDEAAREAVRRWRFAPARRGSTAISAWVIVPVNFQLQR